MATQYAHGKIVTDGLVLCLDAADPNSYPGSGTTWNDVAGTNNGTLTNGPTYSDGSIVFDGVDDYVNFGNIFNDVFAGVDKKFTINSWVRYSNLNDANTILSKHGDSNFGENQRQLFFSVRNPSNAYGSFELEFFAYFNLGISAYAGYRTVNANIQTDTIYNFTISYDGSIDGSSRYGLYINGIYYNNTSTYTNGAWGDIQSGNARVGIGAIIGEKVSNSPRALLNGNIYNTQIYNRNLSPEEVLQNYNAQKSRFGL